MAEVAQDCAFELAVLSDVGTERDHNEDHCGHLVESPSKAVLAVADGVSGYAAGETASKTAIEVLLRAWTEQPATLQSGKRLYRAVQQANIEVHDLAIVVPELRGMATTLTAIAVDGAQLEAAHVGDCRLYLCRDGRVTQLSKDHATKGMLWRSVGRELIVAIDRITTQLQKGDSVLVCSDGLYNVLDEREMAELLRAEAPVACRALIEAANARGTYDNLTAAVVRMTGETPAGQRKGLGARLRRLVGN